MVKLRSIVLGLCVSLAAAHPGEVHDARAVKREINAREYWATEAKRSFSQCSSSDSFTALQKRSAIRRAQNVRRLRHEKQIKSKSLKFRRDLATLEEYELVNHNLTGDGYGIGTPESTIFSANTSCILTPEVTDGPYYVVGERIRHNVKEPLYSEGIDVHLEIQYIDYTNCQPVPNIAVDIWNTNATGVYSGISVSGNYAADGYNSTYLRGVQFTDAAGVVTFETIFPGHYVGRATHTHILAHTNATINRNGTLERNTGTVTHIGQIFYPEQLRSAVEATYPYSTNTQAILSNNDDMWTVVQAGTDYDPFPEFVYLGDTIEDGLLAFIQIGINTTLDMTDNSYYAVAAYYGEDGGEVTVVGGITEGN